MAFGIRLLRGRDGVSGYIRDEGAGGEAAVRGLAPGDLCVLCVLGDDGGRECGRQTADRAGQAQFTVSPLPAGKCYVTAGGRVAAWEAGADAEETWCRACAWEDKRRSAERASESGREAEVKRPPAPPAERQEMEDLSAADSAPTPEADESAGWTLRPAGDGEPVDALPALRWPKEAEAIRPYFRERAPFAPFYAPGWRFARTPSRVPGAAFCAVGILPRDGWVARVAWAVPGSPQRPPVPLPGFTYRPGKQGTGYWVRERGMKIED